MAQADDEEEALISRLEFKSKEELDQYRRDRQSWQKRLDQLAQVQERELAVIADRYRDLRAHTDPVAVVFVVPRQEAIR